MKAIIFYFVAANILITTFLDAMHPFKSKKSPTEKCRDGIEFHKPKKVKHALKKGADPNLIIVYNDRNEQTNLLQLALSLKHPLVVQELLKAPELEINNYPMGTMPPLHCAVSTGKGELVQLLLAHSKTNINILDGQGNTCLFAAVNTICASTLSIGKTLLDNNLDTTIANKQGNTILHHVSNRSYAPWFELILTTKNPPLNVQNKGGDTPLHILCRNNAYSCVEKIISSKHVIDFSILNNDKCSVSDIVLDNGYDLITSLFFNTYPATFISKYRTDRRVFDYAIRANNDIVLQEALPSRYINAENKWLLTPLMIASTLGYIEIIQLLLEQKACKPLYKNKEDKIALHYAAGNGHFACVKKLCEYGDLDHQNFLGNTPLHLASIKQHTRIIDYLVKKGANTLIKNEHGFVPFLIIYQNNSQDKIKETTLNHMIQAKDENNNSLFHIWAEISHISDDTDDTYDYDNCLQFLVEKGLNIYARNNNGLTALDIVNGKPCAHIISTGMMQSFRRVTSDTMQYALFKELLDGLPTDLRIYILILYYKLNISTIFAKIAKIVKKPLVLNHHEYNEQCALEQNIPNDLHYFPLLYRPAVFSYE